MDHLDCGRDQLKYFLRDAGLLPYLETFRDILKITKVSQLKHITNNDLTRIGFTTSEKRRYRKTYDKHFPNPYLARIKGFIRRRKRQMSKKGSLPSIGIPYIEPPDKVPTKHIISMEDIAINNELGMGQFGIVQQGTWTTGNQKLQVAIKCLGQERMSSNSSEFLKEAAVMHSIEHPNIVRLYGVVLHLDSLMLVTELAALRSLLECLREPSLRSDFSVLTLCKFAEQICDGMTYLENKRLIHRDLAARNILVFSKNKVKISDFGLSRALGVGKDYYQTNYNVNLKLPVAWCAPECILYLRFTSASDVWAYGVCLWEMFTYGFQPWAAFTGQQILEAIDIPKCQRLERPFCCPEDYYNLMLECWSHETSKRPKFRELRTRIRDIRPEEVQTLTTYKRPETLRRGTVLEYKAGQIITVLGKEDMTKSSMWYGIIGGGACGLFDPKNVKPYVSSENHLPVESPSSEPECRPTWSMPSLRRSDAKRHTYTGKRSIQCDMISGPQGEVKHTSHVGLDGAHFGDISFLDPAGRVPLQVLYKRPDDLEHVPLIKPNSSTHFKSLSNDRVYSPPKQNLEVKGYDENNSTSAHTKLRTLIKPTNKPVNQPEPTTSRGILSMVKSATLGRSHKLESYTVPPISDDVHEYQEIIDPEVEAITSSNAKTEDPVTTESVTCFEEVSEFSLALMEEMESIMRTINQNKKDENFSDRDASHRFNGLKKKHSLGTMKLMTAQEEKTLNTAVALANEITSKSMSDVEIKRPAASPSDKHKLTFKFAHLTLNNNAPHESDKESTGKQERRNFCDEAKEKVKDIQSTITEESKAAYATLIEKPTPPSPHVIRCPRPKYMPNAYLMPLPAPNCATNMGPLTMPRPALLSRSNFLDVPEEKTMFIKVSSSGARPKERTLNRKEDKSSLSVDETDEGERANVNPLPLPPKSKKLVLVDMPRHIRKYPLKIPNQNIGVFKPLPGPSNEYGQTSLYQNTYKNASTNTEDDVTNYYNVRETALKRTSQSAALLKTTVDQAVGERACKRNDNNVASGSLVKDHVSVEDLLEFADLKPHGRQRGIESDEVRIMMKVLNEKSSPEQCLVALDLCEWDVHHAIKLLRVKISVSNTIKIEDCHQQLLKSYGDITKAVSALNAPKRF